jgi:hypothetical protein
VRNRQGTKGGKVRKHWLEGSLKGFLVGMGDNGSLKVWIFLVRNLLD